MIGWQRALAAIADALCVLVFAIIGRASHAEALTAAGVMTTLAPFWVGFLIGWAVLAAQYRAGFQVRDGLIVAVVTVAAGMPLRALLGGGVQVGFVVVALIVLAGTMTAWRLLWPRLWARLSARLQRSRA